MNSDITINPNITAQLNDLLNQAKKVSQDIDTTNKEAHEQIDLLEKDIDKTVADLEVIYSDLDQATEKAGDELDKIALRESEDLASEE